MGTRIRGVLVVAMVLVTGAFMGSALANWWSVPDSIPAIPGSFPRLGQTERIRVEVLNGGGRPNMARAATETLRAQGFDVVGYGNADEFGLDSSVVLSRAGDVDFARAVADALGIREVRLEPDSNLYLDVSVLIGEAWEPAALEASTSEPPWWDPRTWMRRPNAPDTDARLADPAGGTGRE